MWLWNILQPSLGLKCYWISRENQWKSCVLWRWMLVISPDRESSFRHNLEQMETEKVGQSLRLSEGPCVLPVSLNSVRNASHFSLNGTDTKWCFVTSLQLSAPIRAVDEDNNRTLFRQYSDKVRRFSLEHHHSAATARSPFISVPTVRGSGRRAAAGPPERKNPPRFGLSLHRRVTGSQVTGSPASLSLLALFSPRWPKVWRLQHRRLPQHGCPHGRILHPNSP